MNIMDDSFRLYTFYVLIVVVIIFGIIIIIDILNINLNTKQSNKKLVDIITIEGFNNSTSDIPMIINPAIDFCKSNIDSNDMQDKCGKLTNTNCNKTSCCIWLNNEKCVPGDQNGPTYKTDKKGNKIDINNYYFHNKCNGKCE